MGKTFKRIDVEFHEDQSYVCEFVIENSKALTLGPWVFAGADKDGKLILSRIKAANQFPASTRPFFYLLLSCYAGASILKAMLGDRVPYASDEEICIDPSLFTRSPEIFDLEIDLGVAYLAGAGAIGNSLLFALQFFRVKGLLYVTDPDFVSDGNLNRCLFFKNSDIGNPKATTLVAYAQPLLPSLKLYPIKYELARVPAAKDGGAWLKRLIVAVDSRRGRRHLQSEIPGEVFDASTTGIAEVVTHYNKQPLDGRACMGCIYDQDAIEDAHEKHVTEVLGVTLEQVRQNYIEAEAEILIKRKYPQLTNNIIGITYDTLFKELCGAGRLVTDGDKQVLAPLAFVSALAGALLALTITEHILNISSYNYWRLSPWCNPNYRLQQVMLKSSKCEFCNRLAFQKGSIEIWGK